jgi:hypothetical protein
MIAWRNRRDGLSSVMFVYLVFYLTFCMFNPNIDIIANVSLFCFGVAIVLHQNRELSLPAESTPPQGDDTVKPVAEDAPELRLVEDDKPV